MKEAFDGRSFVQELGVGCDLETSQRMWSDYVEEMFELLTGSHRDRTSNDNELWRIHNTSDLAGCGIERAKIRIAILELRNADAKEDGSRAR